MGYIKFDKTQLINLEYSLNKEMVRSNRSGAFSCATILGCNTRKYHGLLICQPPALDGDYHVLLSKVDETLVQRDAAFNLGINKYPGSFHPKGHKYVRDFSADIIPVITYRVGGVVMTRETMFVTDKDMVMIRYTLQEAHSPTVLRLQPFLAFRNIHRLSKRNIDLNTKYTPVANGISVRMYEGYPNLYLQLSADNADYVHAPDWYNDIEYINEEKRGYEAHEDLYIPGFFEVAIEKGKSIILSAATEETAPGMLPAQFEKEIKKRRPRNSFQSSIMNAAEQFFIVRNEQVSLIAGFPWIHYSGRFTFIALPGLSGSLKSPDACRMIIDHMIGRMKGPFFPESVVMQKEQYNAADTSLWFFHAIQHIFAADNKAETWRTYGGVIKTILEGYKKGDAGISMHDNGLIHIDRSSPALTWMNATTNRHIHTPRFGYVVEINALWYNAIRYAIELAEASGDHDFVGQWNSLCNKTADAFNELFWDDKQGILADFVYDNKRDLRIRPNQVIAAGLEYSPLTAMQIKQILDNCVQELLTSRGLRTLSPRDPMYKGRYRGDALSRNAAYHQGTVWVWPLGFFARAWQKVYGKDNMDFIRGIFEGFEETMTEAGIGTVSEIFEGDPPHEARGTISFAPSLAELLRIGNMIR